VTFYPILSPAGYTLFYKTLFKIVFWSACVNSHEVSTVYISL
jgi:hypothetical protein